MRVGRKRKRRKRRAQFKFKRDIPFDFPRNSYHLNTFNPFIYIICIIICIIITMSFFNVCKHPSSRNVFQKRNGKGEQRDANVPNKKRLCFGRDSIVAQLARRCQEKNLTGDADSRLYHFGVLDQSQNHHIGESQTRNGKFSGQPGEKLKKRDIENGQKR